MTKKILDVCCGGRMFWFNKNHPNALYIDNRKVRPQKLVNRQNFSVQPDEIGDFRKLRFKSGRFSLVVFDPPHIKRNGESGWMAKKYGKLDKKTWREDLRKGFAECFRVLKKDGVLIFKWNEHEIKLADVLELTPHEPLFGHTTGGRGGKTHWITFMKL